MSQLKVQKKCRIRAGNKSLRDGYKAAKELTEHMRGGYEPVKGAEMARDIRLL
jgi:hypothetical protein